jgi:preprotein translocase subunit SecA
MDALERSTTLGLIDDAWKVHLRRMDELKQSVQMAGHEQKDPLLIYKLEAFQLFKNMIGETNTSIVSFLLKAGIPFAQQEDIQEAEVQKTDMRNMTSSHEVFGDDEEEIDQMYQAPTEMPKAEPMRRLEPKIGRNDLCPCGSGKKFKSCHGK